MWTYVGPREPLTGMEDYTGRTLRRMLREHPGIALRPAAPGREGRLPSSGGAPADHLIVLGTAASNPAVARLLQDGFLPAPAHPQGYSVRCAPRPGDPRARILAIAGADPAGTLYALRDIEHYGLHRLRGGGDGAPEPFDRCEHPRIEYRGHWVWGCNMPDKPAWIENMSRWKLNELIHWDNHPPARAREYVAFAHERGVRVVWGFGWGWCPDWNFELPADFDRGEGEGVELCPSSETSLRFLHREILRKVREDYAPTGCDGIYFQSFTECPKCRCPRCAGRTMGELLVRFVNPIVDDIKREFPDLWISCGVHYDFGDYSHLKDLDPRCSIYWENCLSGTSLRGEDEDFGYLHKSIPYGHGYGRTCPADPPYTEASLREWMQGNTGRYAIEDGRDSHCRYMRRLQDWGRRLLGKPSRRKHAGVVADHSVFCRRTPFPHVALAEAQWNPDRDTTATVDGILTFLGTRDLVERTPDSGRTWRALDGRPPWLCEPDGDSGGAAVEREGHAE